MGYINSYGLFEAYYVSNLSINASALAWPGSVQIFLFCLLATVSGRLFDSGYYRHILLFGFSLQLLGIFTTSYATSYYQIFLAQGVAQGIGNGFVLCPTMSLVSTYFRKRRSVAISTVVSGSASGGVVFPLIAQQLIPKIGFGWTVRVMGFVMLANMAIILALARTRIPPRKAGPVLELPAFKEPPYVLFICGMFCIFLAFYFAFTYVSQFCDSTTSRADQRPDQPLCKGYPRLIDRDKSHYSPRHECCWRPRKNPSCINSRCLSWTHQYPHSPLSLLLFHALHMGSRQNTQWPHGLRRHLWLGKRCSARNIHGIDDKFDERLVENRYKSWHGVKYIGVCSTYWTTYCWPVDRCRPWQLFIHADFWRHSNAYWNCVIVWGACIADWLGMEAEDVVLHFSERQGIYR